MSVFDYLACRGHVFLKALHGSVDHDGSESEIDSLLACLKALTVVKMKDYRHACGGSILSAYQSSVLKVDVLSEVAFRDAYDQREPQLLSKENVVLDALHVESVGGRNGVMAFLGLFEQYF